MSRCIWPDGMEIKPDGVNALDPCSYDVVEEHHGVTVRVLRCRRCGHQEIEWTRRAPDWIPITEDLPKGKVGVSLTVAYHDYRYVDAANYVKDGIFESATKPGTVYAPDGDARPIAWMLMPEPYREEDGGDDN